MTVSRFSCRVESHEFEFCLAICADDSWRYRVLFRLFRLSGDRVVFTISTAGSRIPKYIFLFVTTFPTASKVLSGEACAYSDRLDQTTYRCSLRLHGIWRPSVSSSVVAKPVNEIPDSDVLGAPCYRWIRSLEYASSCSVKWMGASLVLYVHGSRRISEWSISNTVGDDCRVRV